MTEQPDISVNQILQQHHGRILGYLIRLTGNFDDAEDLCQDVMEAAWQDWQKKGVATSPLAWLHRTAKNRFTDQYRHQKITNAHASNVQEMSDVSGDPELLDQSLEDDLLKLIFTCCHPALAENVRVALSLRLISGLKLEAVAAAFLIKPKAMEQRLTRAKQKIQRAGIAFEIPAGQQLEPRVTSVMQTLYLMFNEGYFASSGASLIRDDLCREAIRLTTIMQRLFPERAELMSLLALMLFHHARAAARISMTGDLILLEQQDRSLWNRKAIAQASALLDKALYLRQTPGVYQLQAAIAALHGEAETPEMTDWPQITLLYRRLLSLEYTAVLHLNYAVAMAMSGEINQALAELNQIADALQDYFPFYCARADLLIRAAKPHHAITDYEHALTLSNNESESRFIRQRLASLRAPIQSNETFSD